VAGSISIGSQYPVSCGILAATAEPLPDGQGIRVQVAAESLSAVRAAVARVAGMPQSRVIVEAMPMLGSSGGRGDESVRVASLAALVAMKLDQPVRLELDASQERMLTGKRHAVEAEFRVGCDKSGLMLAVDIDLVMDGGAQNGPGQDALEQALLNVDGAYRIADFQVKGRWCRTNGLTGSSIAAEGSAQGILVMEEIISRVARKLGKTADTVRELNFYRSNKGAAETPYGQEIDAELLGRLWIAILSSSKLHQRRDEIEQWNENNHACKRGIAAVPIKMGIGDLKTINNQAAVSVQVLHDGSVRVNIDRVDVGDGLLVRVKKQVSDELGLEEEKVEVFGGGDGGLSSVSKVYGVDLAALMRAAVRDACDQLNKCLGKNRGSGDDGETTDSFTDSVAEAIEKGENLTALGFFTQSGRDWDGDRFHGSPYAEYFYGGAVVEVELDVFTGEVQVLRADLFYQGGDSQNADLDRAQISTAYMMGQGWMLNEEVSRRTHTVPGFEEAPIDFRIELIDVEKGGEKDGKDTQNVSCAEAPVAMAAATREALKEAIFSCASESDIDIDLPIPAGPDTVIKVLWEVAPQAANLERERKKIGDAG
ncbi:MAG: molybdopterin-dependent oxidoreductase, partial [Chloroflexi bacterium]|nr:molybdopterin-dependent oxidoreductase [Chloroflexota bacterium]